MQYTKSKLVDFYIDKQYDNILLDQKMLRYVCKGMTALIKCFIQSDLVTWCNPVRPSCSRPMAIIYLLYL